MNRDALIKRVARHLAGRPVILRWENPPSASAAGQAVKTPDGRLIVYIGELTTAKSRLRVLLHELSHARLDYDFIPISDDHLRQPGSIKRDPEVRQAWRADPREKRAQELADEWLKHANKNAYKYWRVGRDEMTCRLLALLSWEG